MTTTSASRPGGITALGVLTIVLGVFGLLNVFLAILMLLFQGQMQSALANLQPDAEAARAQREVAEQAEQVAAQHPVRNWVLAFIRLNVAVAFLLGGIWTLRLKPIGRVTLLAAFGVGILLEAFQLWPAWEARELSAQMFERMGQAEQGKANGPPGAQAFMEMMGQAVSVLQVAIIVAMFVAKSAFYGFGLWYLTSPRIASLFVRPKLPDPQWA
jgi:hypothetical protein